MLVDLLSFVVLGPDKSSASPHRALNVLFSAVKPFQEKVVCIVCAQYNLLIFQGSNADSKSSSVKIKSKYTLLIIRV